MDGINGMAALGAALAREENLEARARHLALELDTVRGRVEGFRAWLKANCKGNPIEGNIMAERALNQLRILVPEVKS